MPTTAKSIRFTAQELREIERLKKKLGIPTLAGVVKHALARLRDAERAR